MNKKVYYLTRSFYPFQKGGGPLIRTATVERLCELGWEIIVILPNYTSLNTKKQSGIWQIPFPNRNIKKVSSLLERVGIYEDYLDRWVAKTFDILKDEISSQDIVLSTSGGELGMIKLGSMLKAALGCRFLASLHDPLDYGYMNGLRKNKKPHVGRELAQKKYLPNADLIVTSSQFYSDVLRKHLGLSEHKVKHSYFGFIKEIDVQDLERKKRDKLRIAYTGAMTAAQKPELLYHALRNSTIKNEVELIFIGDASNYKPINSIKDERVKRIGFMPHDDYLHFMSRNIDVGFVSLANDYYGACVPSKIFEYINLGLPMLGALPDGDAKQIINDRGFGFAVSYKDVTLLKSKILQFCDDNILRCCKTRVLENKKEFSMKRTISELDGFLREI